MFLDALFGALVQLISGVYPLYLMGGVALGLVVGVFPGLGGIAGLSMLLPFLYGLDPVAALAMLIGLVAIIPTSDTFTSVLMGIPGSSASQATVLDGFPLSKKGEAARALGAAFSASLVGGLIGAVVLTLFVLVARPVVLAFSSAELFMLGVFGLSMVGVLAGRSLAKGLATCGAGLLLGTMGGAPATGEYRIEFDINYLSSGVPLVVVGLALFAVPEIIDLLRSRQTIAGRSVLGRGWIDGIRDTIRHRWLVLRCSGIGCLIGALPGLGGSVVDWIAYGHVVQTSRDKSRFGHGDIRGVLAPESANNAKEGGGLIPTLLFGIPGSGSMAVFLGGMVLIGIQPGIRMVTTDLQLTFSIIWSLALANVIGAGACLLLAKPVARLTTIRYIYLAPFMMTVITFAAFQATRHWGDFVTLFAVSVVAVYMKRFGWPRPAFLIGFVLSDSVETYLYQAVQFHGAEWVQRPGVMIIAGLTLLSIWLGARFSPHAAADGAARPGAVSAAATRMPQLAFLAVMLAFVMVSLVDSLEHSFLGQVFPLSVGIATLACLLWVGRGMLRGADDPALQDVEVTRPREEIEGMPSIEHYLLWILGFLGLMYLVGFVLGVVAMFVVFLRVRGATPWWLIGTLIAAALCLVLTISWFLNIRFPPGLLQGFVDLPWPFG